MCFSRGLIGPRIPGAQTEAWAPDSLIRFGGGLRFVRGWLGAGIVVLDDRVALELLVVLVLDDLLDALWAIVEVQHVIGVGVRREPVFSVDLLPIRLELRKLLALAFEVPDGFAVALHDLQILIIHPNLALKIALAGLIQLFWLHR